MEYFDRNYEKSNKLLNDIKIILSSPDGTIDQNLEKVQQIPTKISVQTAQVDLIYLKNIVPEDKVNELNDRIKALQQMAELCAIFRY